MGRTAKNSNIKSFFKNKNKISFKELYAFFKIKEPELKLPATKWRVRGLVKRGELFIITKGLYSFTKISTFVPNPTASLKQLFQSIKKQFPYLNLCSWETRLLHSYMQHIPGKVLYILEVDKDAIDSVFGFLREKRRNVYMDNAKAEIHKYIAEDNESIIVRKSISQSPIIKIGKIAYPCIEKILVDVMVDKNVLYAYQGAEMENIYRNVFHTYKINIPKMLRYASRRKCVIKLNNLLDVLNLAGE